MTNTDNATPEEPIGFADTVDPADGEVIEQPDADNSSAPAGSESDISDEAAAAATDSVAGTEAGEVVSDDVVVELAERTADLQRLTAEYSNYRRRADRDRNAAVDAAKASVVADLLGILDDLDRARVHGDLESGPLKSVADKLVDALQKQGLEEFGSEGEPFDPNLHEAVQNDGSGHDPAIGTVMRKGYRLGERVLRHALVGVTDGVSDVAAAPEDGSVPEASPQAGASDVDAGADNR